MKLTKSEKEAQQLIQTEINKAIDLLHNHLQKYCDEVSLAYNGVKATSVPMIYINESVKILKQNMQKGMEKALSDGD